MGACAGRRARRRRQMHAVGFGDGRQEGAWGSLQRNQSPLGQKAQFVEQHAVVRVRHQKYQRVFAGQQRQHGFALGHRAGHQRQRYRIGRQVGGVHHVFAQPAADDVLELLLRHVALVHQDLADLASDASFLIALLGPQAVEQGTFADDAGMQEGLPQMAGFPYHRVRRGDQFPEGVRILGRKALGRCRGGVSGMGAISMKVRRRQQALRSEREVVIHGDGCVVRKLLVLVDMLGARQGRERGGGQVVVYRT